MARAKKPKEKKKPEDYKYVKRSFVVGKKEDGTQERVTVRGKNATEAADKLAEAKRLHARGLKGGELTVREWSERWQKSYKTTVSDSQKEHYERKLRLNILPVIGDKRMKDVTKADLQGLMDSYEGGKKGSVEKIKHAICLLFADAVDEGIIERDPAARLEVPEVEEEPRRDLTPIERQTFLKVAAEHPHGAYALVMLYTGMRKGECLALLRSDVDLEKKQIYITKAVKMKGNQGKLGLTKTAEMKKAKSKKVVRGEEVGWRTVPIPDALLPTLTGLCADKAPDALLFPKADGGLASAMSVRGWWKSIKRRCHIAAGAKLYRNAVKVETSSFGDELTHHYLRHTYASDMFSAGVDPFARSVFMGHTSSDVTGGYTHMSDEAMNKALEHLNTYYNGEKWRPKKDTDKTDTGDKSGTNEKSDEP